MWWTPRGERVLAPAEWDLFREGLETLWDWVEESAGYADTLDSGVGAFDRLQPSQQLAMLAQVGRALSDGAMPHPELTVNSEATVAAVFRQIAREVVTEVELSDDPQWIAGLDSPEQTTHWRRLVLAAHREAVLQDEAEAAAEPERGGGRAAGDSPDEEESPGDLWSPPEATSKDVDDWEFVVDVLANRILWEDDDYEAGDDFLDSDPAESRARKERLGIADDYYTDVPPDPTDEQLEAVRRTLRSLCGRPELAEPEMICGLRDAHHALLVGPCDPGTIADEVACRLVEEVEVPGMDGFDCSHSEWADLFREEVHRIARSESTEPRLPEVVLSERQAAEAAVARGSLAPWVLDEDQHRVERREGGWIVIDRHGGVLASVDDAEWVADGGHDAWPALAFPTPEAALIGFLQAEMVAAARSERREEALRRIGRR